MKKSLGISLMASAILFAITVLIGYLIRDNFDMVYNSISELTMKGIERKFLLEVLFYIAFTLLLFGGVLAAVDYKKVMDKRLRIIYILISIVGISGIFMLNFPCPTRGLILVDSFGIIHLIFYIISLIAMILAPLLMWLIFRESKITNHRVYAFYSLITSTLVTLSGVFTGIAFLINIYDNWSIVQKISIGAFILWLYFLGYLVYRDDGNQI